MAFLGIRVPHETGRLLSDIEVPGQKESTSDFHITLLFLGNNCPILEISKTLNATYDVISKIKPFTAKISKIKSFPKKDGECAIVAEVESPELMKLNAKLKRQFNKYNIEYSKIYKDYNPHITLSYAEEEIEKFEIDTIEVVIQEVVLWGGDHGDNRIFVTFPLKSPKRHKCLK